MRETHRCNLHDGRFKGRDVAPAGQAAVSRYMNDWFKTHRYAWSVHRLSVYSVDTGHLPCGNGCASGKRPFCTSFRHVRGQPAWESADYTQSLFGPVNTIRPEKRAGRRACKAVFAVPRRWAASPTWRALWAIFPRYLQALGPVRLSADCQPCRPSGIRGRACLAPQISAHWRRRCERL